MQVLLHADTSPESHAVMTAQLDSLVHASLGRFGARVTRVDAHLSEAAGHSRADSDDVHCALEAQLAGDEPVLVQDQAGSAPQAVAGALRKLRRAVGAAIALRDPRLVQARLARPGA